VDWWKEVELVELFSEAAYSKQRRMLDNLYNNEYQQASSDLKEFLREMIVHWAANAGQIDLLEWAQDRGMHGDTETRMWAASYGHLHAMQWLREDGDTWDSHVISCAEEGGYNYVVEWARENGCLEPYARPNVINMYWRLGWPSIVSCVTTIIMWITTKFHRTN
jgi:hypothetical protein